MANKTKLDCQEGNYQCGGKCQPAKQKCNDEVAATGKLKDFTKLVIDTTDHLGQNVVAWKVGKTFGTGLAQIAIANGMPAELAQIASETILQAGTASLLHTIQHKGKFDGGHLVRELTAATMGKVAHHGADAWTELQGIEGAKQMLIPLLSGKGAGIGAAIGMSKSGIDQAIAKVASKPIEKLRSLFERQAKTEANAQLKAETGFSSAQLKAAFELLQFVVAGIALLDENTEARA